LPGARKNFGAAWATYGEIGDQNGVALAQIGLGDVFLTMGKHSEAKEMYGSSLEISRQLGSRGRQAAALERAGNAQRMGGRRKSTEEIQGSHIDSGGSWR